MHNYHIITTGGGLVSLLISRLHSPEVRYGSGRNECRADGRRAASNSAGEKFLAGFVSGARKNPTSDNSIRQRHCTELSYFTAGRFFSYDVLRRSLHGITRLRRAINEYKYRYSVHRPRLREALA